MNAKQLYELGENIFSKRASLVSMWQSVAENFYPERADFTLTRTIGTEFADGLMTSYPILARRDLSDQISTMLRPTNKDWFKLVTGQHDREDNQAKRWLEWAAQTQKRAMYDRNTMFTRATKEGDADFSAFGQCVLTVNVTRGKEVAGRIVEPRHLLYRCWHLRDVAWMENAEGKICAVWRKWKPHARTLTGLFAGKVHHKVLKAAEKDPFAEICCMHMAVDADMYDDQLDTIKMGESEIEYRKDNYGYVSIHYDYDNGKLMEAVPTHSREYVIPRWQTVSGSQYAFSPATVAALPDARLLQSMMHTLLEAGEKAVNPPVVATQDVVRSDISMFAGGITWVSEEYDEKLGAALRPLEQDLRGIPLGMELYDRIQNMLGQAFYLNKLTLPQRAPEMTAYEVGQRIQEYIRGALPLFEPMEAEYNAQLCEITFETLMREGAFGPPDSLPKSLQGADVQFRFESPLHDAIEQQKGQKFLEAHSILTAAAQLDASAPTVMDAQATLRDVLNGIGCPAKWVRNEEQMRRVEKEQAENVTADDIGNAAKLVKNVAAGEKAAAEIGA